MNRREFIQLGLASLVTWASPNLLAAATNKKSKKFVWLVLRGALDSLHTVVPNNNAQMTKLRPNLYPAIQKQLLPLNQQFGLHPSLKFLHQLYLEQQMAPVVAVSSGYQRRSHFQGQDYLESTTTEPDTGWLARAVEAKQHKALAVTNAMPISLRGSALANTWYPNGLKSSKDELYNKLLNMYQNDQTLHASLSKGLEIKSLLKDKQTLTKSKAGKFQSLCQSCGELLSNFDDVNCAMLELGGWDTHNRQVVRLEQQLTVLDEGLKNLKHALGHDWQNTVVVVATEFGRTARENGTFGTDHGTASNLFLLGGAIKGGQVLGHWPGLKESQLFENRDLQPTSNSFDWIATLLAQHWQLNNNEINKIFVGKSKTLNKQLIIS